MKPYDISIEKGTPCCTVYKIVISSVRSTISCECAGQEMQQQQEVQRTVQMLLPSSDRT